MDLCIARQLSLPHVSVRLATVRWSGSEEIPAYTGYSLSQRLSEDHSPLRIGNLQVSPVLPRVHSVGLLPPGQAVRLLPVEAPLEVLYCVFDPAYFEAQTGIGEAQWSSQLADLVSLKNRRLEVLMQELHAEMQQPGQCHEQLVSAVTTLLVVELARSGSALLRPQPTTANKLTLAPWQLHQIERRIRDAPARGYPGVGELAALCGVSEGHLARGFKGATGWQLQKYIARERLKMAKTLLEEETLSCEAIASRLGFGSASYFSSHFRRMTGLSPTEFRRRARAAPAT